MSRGIRPFIEVLHPFMIVKIAIGVTVILQIHKGFVSLQVITLSLKVTKKRSIGVLSRHLPTRDMEVVAARRYALDVY